MSIATSQLAALRWCLRITVALQCAGVVARSRAGAAPIFSLLWHETEAGGFGWSEPAALACEKAARWALLLAIPFILWRPCWPVLLPVALWQFALAAASVWLGESFFLAQIGVPWLEIPAHAARFVAPLALLLFDPWPRKEAFSAQRASAGEWLMRLAVAATFLAHGWEAFQHHPVFIDYLIAADGLFGQGELSEDAARQILTVIGLIDFLVGVLILVARWRYLALYMAFWGAITAGSRIVQGSWPAYFETIIRAANAGLPLALAIYWWYPMKPADDEPVQLEEIHDS